MIHVAIISDLHADLGALDVALARARTLGCDLVVCAGDLIDGDTFPDEVIARLAAERIPTVRGNHDRWALERARGEQSQEMFGGGWDLSPASLRFLAALPTTLTLELEGVRLVVWHASPGSDMQGIDPARTSPRTLARLLTDAGGDILVVGHTHEAFAARASEGRLVINPGALYTGGMSFRFSGTLHVPDPDGVSGGTFGVLELPARRFRVYRVRDGALVIDSE